MTPNNYVESRDHVSYAETEATTWRNTDIDCITDSLD